MPAEPAKTSSPKSRDRIIQAARRVFLSRGYAASLDEVAREAGVGRRTLYNQFENKDALLRAMIHMLAERKIAPLFADAHDQPGLRDYLLVNGRRYLDMMLDEENLQIYRFFVTDLVGHRDLLQLTYSAGFETLTGELADVLRAEMEKGRLRTMDAKLAADRFLSSVVGSARHRAILGLGVDDDQRRSVVVAAAVDNFIDGLKSER